MPIESSRKDLQIIACHFYVRFAPSWHNLCHKVSNCVKVFASYSFFLSPDQFSVNDWDTVTEKLAIRFQ